jgi:hypothetical protein
MNRWMKVCMEGRRDGEGMYGGKEGWRNKWMDLYGIMICF